MGSSTSKHPPTFADRVILDQFNSKRTLAEIQIPQLCGYLLLGVPNAAMPILPKRWRRRYFVLIDSRLECYAGNQAKSRLLCTFSIRGCTVESGGVKKKSHLRFGVCSNDVTWLHLIADNEGLKQVWMNAIRTAADPKFTSISRQLVSEVAQGDSKRQALTTTPSTKTSPPGKGTPTTENVQDNQEEEDGDDHAMDIDAPVFARQVSYDIQTEEEVASTMEATITDAAAAMSLSPVKARALLAGRGWNLSDLISDVLEPSKRTKVCEKKCDVTTCNLQNNPCCFCDYCPGRHGLLAPVRRPSTITRDVSSICLCCFRSSQTKQLRIKKPNFNQSSTQRLPLLLRLMLLQPLLSLGRSRPQPHRRRRMFRLLLRRKQLVRQRQLRCLWNCLHTKKRSA